MLTLMYITNNETIAQIAQEAGVDRIWIDMEYIGKEERQGGMDTVKSHHVVEDIVRLRPIVTSSELMVRINPIHDATSDYCSSEEEIDQVIAAGADVIMLPMFKSNAEVERFVYYVNGRAKVMLLLETAEGCEELDDILTIPGINEIHIGLNDLHLAYKKTFMFELVADGTVASLCQKIRSAGIKYGFGGVARIGYGMLPAEYIITDHYMLGSTAAILSRGFCDANRVSNPREIEKDFFEGVKRIREYEEQLRSYTDEQFEINHQELRIRVQAVVQAIKNKK